MTATTVQRAKRSVFGIFALCGLAISSLLSRVPQVRDTLDLRPGPLGLLLLMIAVGSLLSLPLAGLVVQRVGTARTVAVMTGVNAAGLAVAAVGTRVGPALAGVGLFLFGFGAGLWDVAQNVEGAAVEQRLGRSVMSRFHAVFSLGTIAGALGGASMNALGVALLPHLLAVAAVVAAGGVVTARGFLPGADESAAGSGAGAGGAGGEGGGSVWQAWTEPRTLLIGLFVLCMAFAEGTGNDWLGVATIDGYGASATVGSFAYVTLVTAMTIGRWFGPGVLDRHGRVPVLRAGSVCSLAGVLVVVFGPSLGTAFAGMALWGLGVALGFPTGMSAAADDPTRAAARVSVVATIGYGAFLAGPSLIGAIGDHAGVRRALTLTAALLAVATALAAATREGATAPGGRLADTADPAHSGISEPPPARA